jgi:hypothetical protein
MLQKTTFEPLFFQSDETNAEAQWIDESKAGRVFQA